MPTTPAQLLAPDGRIDAVLFPSDDSGALSARLEGYIADGVARAAGLSGAALDAASEAWAYYRAFDAIHLRLASAPSTWNVADQGGRSYTADQIRSFRTIADRYEAEFYSMIARPAPAPADEQRAGTRNVPTSRAW